MQAADLPDDPPDQVMTRDGSAERGLSNDLLVKLTDAVKATADSVMPASDGQSPPSKARGAANLRRGNPTRLVLAGSMTLDSGWKMGMRTWSWMRQRKEFDDIV
jgi:hypothetical protein